MKPCPRILGSGNAEDIGRLTNKNSTKEITDMKKRFEVIEKDGLMEGTRIIVDTETGVQYLMAHWTNIGGITVLVDRDGKPLLDPRYAK